MKLFRKYRRRLIDPESKKSFKKYVVYALGEIILVVIGILLALGINNWNENRIKIDEQEVIAKSRIKANEKRP